MLSKLKSLPVIGLFLCAASCALPLIAAIGLPAAVAGFISSPTQLAISTSVVIGALVLATAYYLRKSGRLLDAPAPACSTGCECKTARNQGGEK